MIRVLSPDRITIEFEPFEYEDEEKAIAAFIQWRERYRAQGYYSSNRGRIDLKHLHLYCTWQCTDGEYIDLKQIPKYDETITPS